MRFWSKRWLWKRVGEVLKFPTLWCEMFRRGTKRNDNRTMKLNVFLTHSYRLSCGLLRNHWRQIYIALIGNLRRRRWSPNPSKHAVSSAVEASSSASDLSGLLYYRKHVGAGTYTLALHEDGLLWTKRVNEVSTWLWHMLLQQKRVRELSLHTGAWHRATMQHKIITEPLHSNETRCCLLFRAIEWSTNTAFTGPIPIICNQGDWKTFSTTSDGIKYNLLKHCSWKCFSGNLLAALYFIHCIYLNHWDTSFWSFSVDRL